MDTTETGNTAFANAVARRTAIAAEIKRHRERIDALRKESKRITEWLANYDRYRDTPPDAFLGAPQRPANPAKELISEHVRRLLAKNGAPMLRSELTAGLADEGVILEGNDPNVILSTMLWRMKNKVVHLKKFGYWLADRDYPPAGYKAVQAAPSG